jgi:hypothetical protein
VEEKCKGFWKMNNSILNDISLFSILLSITAVSLHASLASNVFSKVLVSSLVSFAFILLNVIVITLEKTLEAKLACSDTAVIDNKILNNEIDKLEKELEQIYEQKAKGARIRSREKWVEFGEKNNAIKTIKYFILSQNVL